MAPRSARAKGTAWESAIARYLRDRGVSGVERRALAGSNDRGDLTGVPGWTIEAKSTSRLDLAGALKEAQHEAENAHTSNYCAILKRRNSNVADGYVVMPLSVFANLVQAPLAPAGTPTGGNS